MTLELAWLRTWVSVVDCGGFARAAEQTHLSQPRVSAHIANLERELGCQLIERRVRPLTLTDDGRTLLAQARAVIAAADELVDSSRAGRGIVAGSVNVASFVSGSAEFLPAVLTKLKKDHPQLNVGVLDGDVGFIETALSERRVSVALRPLRPEPRDRALAAHPLWREPFVVLAPSGHPLLGKDEVDLADLDNQRIITIGNPLANTTVGYEVDTELSIKDMIAPYSTVSHQPTTLGAMVRAGLGVGVVNYLAATMVRGDGMEIRPIRDLQRYRDVGIWWHLERPLNAAAKAFVRAVIDAPPPAGTTRIPGS
jgi:DNA-binding transcriptional LysR family regulator